MSKDRKLEHCECLTKYEKDTLVTALNSAKIDAQRSLNESYRGVNVIGAPAKEVREGLELLIRDYSTLKDKVDNTPVCQYI